MTLVYCNMKGKNEHFKLFMAKNKGSYFISSENPYYTSPEMALFVTAEIWTLTATANSPNKFNYSSIELVK